MIDKETRLEAIRKIIKSEWVHSQDYLLSKLLEEGIEITQATLSRDLKLLEVAKVADEEGYHYSIPAGSSNQGLRKGFIKDLERSLQSVAISGNLAVVKTRIGHGNSVALALDNLEISGIMGTIAGDDTVFIALSKETQKEQFLKDLQRLLPTINII